MTTVFFWGAGELGGERWNKNFVEDGILTDSFTHDGSMGRTGDFPT